MHLVVRRRVTLLQIIIYVKLRQRLRYITLNDGTFGCDYNVFYTRRLYYPLPIFKRLKYNKHAFSSVVGVKSDFKPTLDRDW